MADNKKYYYMRLKENFFDTDDLKFLAAMDKTKVQELVEKIIREWFEYQEKGGK